MSLDEARAKPHERLAEAVAPDMAAVNVLIRERMASEHAPRIPEVTAHLVEAGGKRLRPMLTLASARMCGYGGPYHIHHMTSRAQGGDFLKDARVSHNVIVNQHSYPARPLCYLHGHFMLSVRAAITRS